MNNLNIAYAALLHDIGKFYQRTTKISLLNSQEIASTPIHANGYHTHIHSGYTAKFFHDYLHLNDQLEKASSGHHINEVDEFDSIISFRYRLFRRLLKHHQYKLCLLVNKYMDFIKGYDRFKNNQRS